jgi:hypothetical protein
MAIGKGKPGARFGSQMHLRTALDAGPEAGGKWRTACLHGLLLKERSDEFETLVQAKGYEYRYDIADQMKLLKWVEDWDNLITNVGLTYLIGSALIGVSPITTWYIGLVSGATPTFDATDTMGSHAGWTEDEDYDEAARVTWAGSAGAAGITTNAAGVAIFNMSGTTTIGGAFLTSVNTKGGTTGTLYAEGDFSPDRSVVDNDVLEVTGQLFVADDGV